jgi:hypothetical protein
MRFTLAVPLFVLLAGLTACAPMPVVPPASSPGPSVPDVANDTCNAGANAGLIGQPATALERVLIMAPIRIIRPGDAVTMDFMESRINFELDQVDRIVRIFCG